MIRTLLATPPRNAWGAVDEYPHLDPVQVWEEVTPSGAVIRCRVDHRRGAMIERLRGGVMHIDRANVPANQGV